ncbi:hypothetical protein VPH35_092914 [Triticum aestivum]|uniref:Uncharacterized protein n=1 Tax=Triticum aestivum TaxID=4565 RepID=A0A3B6LT78_WHEAT
MTYECPKQNVTPLVLHEAAIQIELLCSVSNLVGGAAVAVDKPFDEPDHLAAGVAVWLDGEEPVVLPLELHELHWLLHGLEPRGIVHGAVAQQVVRGGHHEHRRQRYAVQRRAIRAEGVGQRVVPRGPRRQHQAPRLVDRRQRQERARRELRLRRRPLLPAEQRAEHRAPGDANEVEGAEPARREADGRVVDDAPAGRVPGDEHPAEVRRLREPWVGVVPNSRRLAAHPGQDVRRVVEARGEPVLGGEAVVCREHHSRELAGEADAARVEVGHVEAADGVPAAVEVDDHRELVPGGGGRRRPVDAELEAVAGVVHDVLPVDDGLAGRRRRDGERVAVSEADHRAVAEELQERRHVLHDVRRRGGRHGRGAVVWWRPGS